MMRTSRGSIAPSTIYGIGSGPFNKVSQQVIALAKAAAHNKKAGYVGDNKNVRWGDVWINDLVDLYMLVLEGLLEGKIEHGKEGGWYFCSNGEHTWGEVAEKLASVLHSKGLVDTLDVAPFDKETIDKFLFGDFATLIFGHESRAVANRSKKIGWKPHDKPTVLDVIEEEVQYLIDHGLLPKPEEKKP
jgi:nucleoside-diphosphate-sugar epimerase